MSAPTIGSRRERELRRIIEQVVEGATSNYSIELTARTHIRVTIRRAGQQRTIFTGGTPSDRRELLNFKSSLRRAWKDMGGPDECIRR